MLFDTHTHLCDDQLVDRAEDIISAFGSQGLQGAIEVGYDLDSSIKAVALAEAHDNIFAAVGIHPCDNVRVDGVTLERLLLLAKTSKVVAIGEVGFDFHYDNDKDIQRYNFVAMLKLAKKIGKPIILHIRDAYGELDNYIDELKSLSLPILFHCYAGSLEKTNELIAVFGDNAYFAFGGVITFNNFKKQDVLCRIPKDRLLLETDSPYMTPVPHRGEPNTPLNVALVADKAAEILGMDRQELVDLTTANAKRFFKIV